jgi:hypothetical protein
MPQGAIKSGYTGRGGDLSKARETEREERRGDRREGGREGWEVK